MIRIIEVVVSPSGDITVQTRGYVGGECLAASKFMEEALGIVLKDQRTSAFYGQSQSETHVHQ